MYADENKKSRGGEEKERSAVVVGRGSSPLAVLGELGRAERFLGYPSWWDQTSRKGGKPGAEADSGRSEYVMPGTTSESEREVNTMQGWLYNASLHEKKSAVVLAAPMHGEQG